MSCFRTSPTSLPSEVVTGELSCGARSSCAAFPPRSRTAATRSVGCSATLDCASGVLLGRVGEVRTGVGDGAHGVMDAAAAESVLGKYLGAVFRAEQVVQWHPHVTVDDVIVVSRSVGAISAAVAGKAATVPVVSL
jgi:hypothetical protein